MNLVEATIDGDEVSFGQFRVPLDPERRPASRRTRVVLGIRPESFEDAAFARHDLPTLDVEVAVLEELGSDAHVFFPVDAPPVTPEVLEAEGEDDAQLVAVGRRVAERPRRPAHAARVGASLAPRRRPARFHFFDAETGASLLDPDRSMVLTS